MTFESYKFRLYPTADQKVLLNKHFGSVRFVYNWALAKCQEKYKTDSKFISWMSLVGGGDFIKLKQENKWLYEVNSQSLVNSISHLGNAFDRFFKHLGNYPVFKKKHESVQSFEVPAKFFIDFKHKKIQIPRFVNKKKHDNRISFVLSRKVVRGKIGTATISKNAANQYYVSFTVKTEDNSPEPDKHVTKETSLGIDFGIKKFLTLSNGEVIKSPEFLKSSLRVISKNQKILSKKQIGSNNREKQRIRTAKKHLHVENQRKNFLHVVTTKLVKDSQFNTFCIEDLNLQAMFKLWGRKMGDVSFGTFVRMLEYKCVKNGKRIIKIGRFEPSSQVCSNCGGIQKIDLSTRVYNCQMCGLSIDRDVNAAINIRDFAIKKYEKDFENTDGVSEINACGDTNL